MSEVSADSYDQCHICNDMERNDEANPKLL